MPKRRNLFDSNMRPMMRPADLEENEGMGQEQPVRRPLPNGAPDESQAGALPQPPPIQPIPPPVGMTPLNMATPGAGGDNSEDLINILMGLQRSGY